MPAPILVDLRSCRSRSSMPGSLTLPSGCTRHCCGMATARTAGCRAGAACVSARPFRGHGDRTMRELVAAFIVRLEHRYDST